MHANPSGDLPLHRINLDLIGSQLVRAAAALTNSEAELAQIEAELAELTNEQIGPDDSSTIDAASMRCREARHRTRELRAHIERLRNDYTRLDIAVHRPDYCGANDQWEAQRHPIQRIATHLDAFGNLKRSWEHHSGVCATYLHQNLMPEGPAARKLMFRQAGSLFALCAAFLQYYFLDVNLQIARLPATIVRLT